MRLTKTIKNTRSFLITQGTTPISFPRKVTFISAQRKADKQRNCDDHVVTIHTLPDAPAHTPFTVTRTLQAHLRKFQRDLTSRDPPA
jgi:hypothetical protein